MLFPFQVILQEDGFQFTGLMNISHTWRLGGQKPIAPNLRNFIAIVCS